MAPKKNDPNGTLVNGRVVDGVAPVEPIARTGRTKTGYTREHPADPDAPWQSGHGHDPKRPWQGLRTSDTMPEIVVDID